MGSGRPRLRVLFIGTDSAYSLIHLEALARHYDVVAVLQSIRRAHGYAGLLNRFGRSRLRNFASARGMTFVQADRRQLEVLPALCARERIDLACVAGMTSLLPAHLLDIPRLGFLNVHPAMLPAWRGPFPVFWQLLQGLDAIGVTVHRLAPGEDDGPILLQGEVPVLPTSRHADLIEEVSLLGGRLLVEAVELVALGRDHPMPQPATSPTPRARRVGPNDAQLLCATDMPIERCIWLIAAIGDPVAMPRPRLRDLGWRMEVAGWRRPAPGDASHEWDGRSRIGHPQGTVALARRWRPRAWAETLVACRRAGIGWKQLW